MRGLTTTERDALVRLVETFDAASRAEIDTDTEEAPFADLVATGRARMCEDELWVWWEPTPAGRLALRLWPSTRATVPATTP